ncbi:MAG: adenylate/guanylate cyclase domain-containing protein [Thermodesulfobacteriota bacterium]|nr:adenylate/guanylate cyclase domain-containing protein [Thermodesulfobacteriota bacterium]
MPQSRPVDESSNKDSIQKMAVLFTDIVASTRYFKSHGDLAGRQMLQLHQDFVFRALVDHSGILVKTLGDSVLAYFFDPKEAIRAAIIIQQDFKEYNKGKEPEDQVRVRIGIHYGDGIVEEDDIFGNVVNLAAKLLTLVDGDQIYISQDVYALVQDLKPVFFELVDHLKKKRILKRFKIYQVVCDETIKFDPTVSILLYVKPLWDHCKQDFAKAWDSLLNEKHKLWTNKIDRKNILEDKSLLLIVKEASMSIDIAKDVLTFMRKKLGNVSVPAKIIIDSGSYLRADKLILESFEIDWNTIDAGEIYISSSANKYIMDNNSYPAVPVVATEGDKCFYRLIQDKHHQKCEPEVSRTNYPPCFYCGDSKHLAIDCPSKMMKDRPYALQKLGYLSEKRIKELFEDFQNRAVIDNEASNSSIDSSYQLIQDGFYELKYIFQLRFFRNIWDSIDKSWDRIKENRKVVRKGGPIWLAQDCIRTSNLVQAEQLLNDSMHKCYNDYKAYCAMGFLNIDKGNYRQAGLHLNQALEYTKTKPEKMFLLFLFARMYDLRGNFAETTKKIREISLLDSKCPEAIYQYIIFKFRSGLDAEALTELIQFIQKHREYYINALIDPELATYKRVIHPALKRLFNEAKEKAEHLKPKAQEEIKKLNELFTGKDERIDKADELERTESLLLMIKELSKSESYFGYLDIIHYANSISYISRKSIENRRKKINEEINKLYGRCRKQFAFAGSFPNNNRIQIINNRLKAIRAELDAVNDMSGSSTPEVFNKAIKYCENISAKIDRIEIKLKRLANLREFIKFLSVFFRKSLILQTINLFIAMIVVPIAIHYTICILPKYRIANQVVWLYQKGFVVMGGMFCLLLALVMTVKKLYPTD